MHIQGKLIERALLKSDFTTYGELADNLGVTAATMSQWRSGASKLPTKRMEQLAAISGDDPGIWAITLMAEESNVSTNLRSAIQRILKTAGGAAVALFLTVGLTQSPAQSSDYSYANQGHKSIHYAK